jgi:type IV secretory pathway VirB2 component (pilin)
MLPMTVLAGYAPTSGSLADPAGSSVLVAAIWLLQATLLGTVATTVAIVAVASVGLMMLAGRVDVRYGLTVIAGSFILFGASSIVAGIQASMAGPQLTAAPDPPPPLPAPPLPPPPPADHDPYAGASLPTR